MVDGKSLSDFARSYLSAHPEEVMRLAKNVALLRLGVPLEAFRVLTGRMRGSKAPRDVEVEAVPPGIRIAATVNVMKTDLRAGFTLYFDRVVLNSIEMRFELRVRDVSLAVIGESESPLAGLIKSGALDLSKPGNLVAFMPKRPALLVEAEGDRVVVDLMKHPGIARKAGRVMALVTPLLGVKSVETDSEHLDVYLECFPDGVTNALATLREHL
jgi:hypothetical protein